MPLTATHSPAQVLHAFTHPTRRAATPADAQALAGATRHSVAGVGHRRILREPTVIAQAVAFIQHTLNGSAA